MPHVSVSERDVAPAGDRLRVAWAWGLIGVTAVAFSLLRAMAVNLPWHLATARMAFDTGHWPAHNTFSYTFPDYPVFQQYPAFQAAMWGVYRATGWEGLSVATALVTTPTLLLNTTK